MANDNSSSDEFDDDFDDFDEFDDEIGLHNADNPNNPGENERDLNCYLPLYRAVLNGDWESASTFFQRDPDAIKARFGAGRRTALHIAVEAGRAIHFVDKLLELMPTETLALTNDNGETALFDAAATGNTAAAKLLVKKNPDLPNTWSTIHPALPNIPVPGNRGLPNPLYRGNMAMPNAWNRRYEAVPLHSAARHGHKEVCLYLLGVTRDDVERSPFAGFPGQMLLKELIISGLHDVALHLVQRYPRLPVFPEYSNTPPLPRPLPREDENNPLVLLAKKPSAFPSGIPLNFWEWTAYQCAPVELGAFPDEANIKNAKNSIDDSQLCTSTCCSIQSFIGWKKVYTLFWVVIGRLVPRAKFIQEEKVKHHQTLQLLKHLCMQAIRLEFSKTRRIFTQPVTESATRGIPEIVEEIVELFPHSLWDHGAMQQDIFRLAIKNRHQKIFNLIYQVGEHRLRVTRFLDSSNNNVLHLAGKLSTNLYPLGPFPGPPASSHQPKHVTSAALLMQRELQWYKEVEKMVPTSLREMENWEKKTPKMVFTQEHRNLVREGEKWMKEKANAYKLVAALFAIIAFVAGVTILGIRKHGEGSILHFKETAIKIFAVSDAVSLLSSIASMVVLLSILCAHYAEGDFLHFLPSMLILGLVTLLASITSLMIALTAALYLVFGEQVTWTFILVSTLASLPVTLFVILQYPLLVELIYSTYGPSIFGKQSNRVLY